MATITLTRFEEAGAALRHPDLAQAMYDEGAVITEGTLLTLHGEAHRRRRNLEFKVFRRDFFRYYEQEVFPRTAQETLAAFVKAGRGDLVDFGYRATTNLSADFAGIDRPERSTEETEALLALIRVFGEGATLVHSTRPKDEVREEVRAALEVFDARFLKPSIARREEALRRLERGAIGEEELPRDVLTVLLRNEDALDLPPDLLRREVAFYLQAGSHSTANSTTHAMHEIFAWSASHPDDGRRLREDLMFLQRCVHESFRLHPASPVAWRRPTCPVSFAGREAAAGDRVVIDIAAANRDPALFGEDAARFDPHRTIPVGQVPYGLTFGSGAHACLGRDLDGGVFARAGADPARHQYGIVALLARLLLEAGARPDPDDPAIGADYTERPNWGRYPFVFDPPAA